MTVQVLTLEAVKTAARAAFHARKLTAQAKRREDRRCEYSIGDCKCAIGAALTAETLAVLFKRNLNARTSVDSLRYKDVIDVPLSDREALAHIQKAHDDWASMALARFRTERQVRRKREAFKKLIGLTVRS